MGFALAIKRSSRVLFPSFGQTLRRTIRELTFPALFLIMGYQQGTLHPARFHDSWPAITAALLVLLLLRLWAGNEKSVT